LLINILICFIRHCKRIFALYYQWDVFLWEYSFRTEDSVLGFHKTST